MLKSLKNCHLDINFNYQNLLGKGAYAKVYKGTISATNKAYKNNDNNFWNEKFIKEVFKVTLDEESKAAFSDTKGWCSHHKYLPLYLHFCSAIYKSDLIKIGKFCFYLVMELALRW